MKAHNQFIAFALSLTTVIAVASLIKKCDKEEVPSAPVDYLIPVEVIPTKSTIEEYEEVPCGDSMEDLEDELKPILVKPNIVYVSNPFKLERKTQPDMSKFHAGVKHWEGFKSKLYTCCGGKKTIGYGFTGKEIKGRKYITKWQASYELKKEILPRYYAHVDRIVKVKLNPHQRLALVSFCYNLGPSYLKKLVNGRGRLNSGSYKSIERLLPLYRKAGGKIRRGLELRRAWELRIWNGEIDSDYGN